MTHTVVKSIEIPSTVTVADGPARQTTLPVQRRIVSPLRLHPSPKMPRVKPVRVVKSDIATELAEIRKAWRIYRSNNSRDAVYIYLSKVFGIVTRWRRFNCAVKNCQTALRLQPNPTPMKPEPFGIVIFCTSDTEIVDAKTRSKWSRVLRYAAQAKPPGQRLIEFVKSNGGLNECARKFARMAG